MISGLSGAGKGTIASKLVKDKSKKYVLSISATSRDKRKGEKEGRNYFFKTKPEFRKMIKNNELLEYATYVGNYYGTPKAHIEENLKKGKNVILEIEMKGALQVKKKYKDSVLAFIMPKDAKTQRERLLKRGRENKAEIKKRLLQAVSDAKYAKKYDYVVVNNKIEQTMKDMNAIVKGKYSKAKNKTNLKLLNTLVSDIKGGNYV